MPNHTVQQFETMSSIAEKYGFANVKTIWNHGNNAALKAKRKNAHVLFPGDVVFVPDKVDRPDSAPTTKYNRYQVAAEKLNLIFRLRDSGDQPFANSPVDIEIDGAKTPPPTTDGEGKANSVIKRSAKQGLIAIPEVGALGFRVGGLDPVEETTGQIARLNNLGYVASDPDKPDAAMLQSAIEEFQCDHGIKVTGVCDAATRDKLELEHGC